ncbi:MAG: M3 family oligoendopeptidase [Spirochaetaceae bacterium]|nr:M3 family oligoendopeptidase [Spirochaetaceae bacterium]
MQHHAIHSPETTAAGPAAESVLDPAAPPAWDLSPEYASFEDPVFTADLARVETLAAELESLEPLAAAALPRAEALDPAAESALAAAVLRSFVVGEELDRLFGNCRVYANCVASVDGSNARAKELRGVFSSLGARIDKAGSAFALLLARASEPFVAAVLADPAAAPEAFRVGQSRKYRDRLLELVEEKVAAALSPDGLHAWGRLYDAITGSAKARLRLPGSKEVPAGAAPASAAASAAPAAPAERVIGLSEAAALLRDADRGVREAAFRAQTEAFAVHEESLAAILNAIAGWRLAEYGMRSRKAPMHFLDAALASNRLERATLDAMLGVVAENRELGRRALRLQARLMGVERLSCFDTLAPAPRVGGLEGKTYSFAEGLELVRGAYASVDPAMGDFVLEMRDSGRIEARVLPAKRPGAYCTRFPKTRAPRVFQTYRGALADVSTLAHELGHAYHGKLLASLPLAETEYPMNLAETASTFAETALGDYLDSRSAADPAGRLEVAWSDAQDAATFLVNIPARFAFEKAFYERRAEKPLGAAALSELMDATMREHYGDALSEYDAGFWKSKLHFYMSGLSFYNFPYTFGYLFSLGVYARRADLGAGFHKAYCALLRDTGRMETEDLAEKHLGVDLRKPDFWRASVAMVKAKVDRFEAVVDGLAPRGGAAARA